MSDLYICLTQECQQQRIIKNKQYLRNHAKHVIHPYESFKSLISSNPEIYSKVTLWKTFNGLENYFKATIRKLKKHLEVDEYITQSYNFIMNNQLEKISSDMINLIVQHLEERPSKIVEEEIRTINEIQSKIMDIFNEFGFPQKPEIPQPEQPHFVEKKFDFSLSGKFLFDWDMYKNSVKERPTLDILKLKEEIKKERNLTHIDLNLKQMHYILSILYSASNIADNDLELIADAITEHKNSLKVLKIQINGTQIISANGLYKAVSNLNQLTNFTLHLSDTQVEQVNDLAKALIPLKDQLNQFDLYLRSTQVRDVKELAKVISEMENLKQFNIGLDGSQSKWNMNRTFLCKSSFLLALDD